MDNYNDNFLGGDEHLPAVPPKVESTDKPAKVRNHLAEAYIKTMTNNENLLGCKEQQSTVHAIAASTDKPGKAVLRTIDVRGIKNPAIGTVLDTIRNIPHGNPPSPRLQYNNYGILHDESIESSSYSLNMETAASTHASGQCCFMNRPCTIGKLCGCTLFVIVMFVFLILMLKTSKQLPKYSKE